MTALVITDESLAGDARGGCRAGFEQLVIRYQLPLMRFLQRGPVPGCAEDDVQETFLRVYRSLDKYNPERPFRPWLFSVAYRIALDRRRAIRKTVPIDERTAGRSSSDPVDSATEADERGHLWSLARSALKSEPFACLWLHYGESMPVAEIAVTLGRSVVWVKTSLLRSRRRLKGVLEAGQRPAEPATETTRQRAKELARKPIAESPAVRSRATGPRLNLPAGVR